MKHNWLLYVMVFISAFIISIFITPLSSKISYKLKAIDYPKKRGMHNDPIPRLGGIAIVVGFFTALLLVMPLVPELNTKEFLGIVVGSMIIVILGFLDDIYSIKPGSKLAFQIMSALVVIYSGTRIEVILWPFHTQLNLLSVPITLIWIIGIVNAVNLIDGLDGLAAGVSCISALAIMVLCIISGSPFAVLITSALSGSCLGFLPRNFNPAEVIMGDTGALFLGFILGVSSISGVFKSYAVFSIIIAFFILALPVFDTVFAIIRRLINGKPIMIADRGHLHHKLIDAGYSYRHTILTLYGISTICAILAIIIALKNLGAFFILALIIIIILMMFYIYKKRL